MYQFSNHADYQRNQPFQITSPRNWWRQTHLLADDCRSPRLQLAAPWATMSNHRSRRLASRYLDHKPSSLKSPKLEAIMVGRFFTIIHCSGA
jgi:hypothetical protein